MASPSVEQWDYCHTLVILSLPVCQSNRLVLFLFRGCTVTCWFKQIVGACVRFIVKMEGHHPHSDSWKKYEQLWLRQARLQRRAVVVFPDLRYVHAAVRILQGLTLPCLLSAWANHWKAECESDTIEVRLILKWDFANTYVRKKPH